MREHAFHDFALRYPDHHIECDFGPLRVRVPTAAWPRMSDPDDRYSDAVFFDLPHGTVRLSVLAAPRAGGLWLERAEEIAAERARAGELVYAYGGEWGPELRITDATTTNWVIGREGPRWMLLGRATCEAGDGSAETGDGRVDGRVDGLADTMRAMMSASVVVRGDEPLPVRTPLPLTDPGASGAHQPVDAQASPYTGAMTLYIPSPRNIPSPRTAVR